MRTNIEITVPCAGEPSRVIAFKAASERVEGSHGPTSSVVSQGPDCWPCRDSLAGRPEGFWRLVANAAAFAANEEEKR
jgi:hypothetical protein